MTDARITSEETGTLLLCQLLRWPYHLGNFLSGVFIFVCYVILAEWSYAFVIPPNQSAVFWLPSGITFALFLRARYIPQLWPTWVISFAAAEFLVASQHETPMQTALIWAIGNALLGLSTVGFSRLFTKPPFAFRRMRNVFTFVAVVFLAVIPSAILGGLGLVMGFPDHQLTSSILSWGISDVLGILFLAPIILTWSAEASPFLGKKLEAGLLFTGLLLFTVCSSQIKHHVVYDLASFSFLIFFAAWSAIRFGPRGMTVVLLAIDLVYIWATREGFGVFSQMPVSAPDKLLGLQLLIVNIGILMLLLASAIEEQRTARIKAEEAAQMRDDFLSVASHELKTPLSSLTLQVQLLNRHIHAANEKKLTQDALVRMVEISERELRRFSKLINDLLDVSRISAGQLPVNLERIDLVELTRETLQRFGSELERSKSTLKFEAEGEIYGNWDRLRLEQLVTNLFINAIKYGAGKPILVKIESSLNEAKLTFTDQGIGISELDQGRIFRRFERAVSLKQFGGLGLGLFIARQIVETFGGTIRVESREHAGSSFIVTLPIATDSCTSA